jgi:hypothetical protein
VCGRGAGSDNPINYFQKYENPTKCCLRKIRKRIRKSDVSISQFRKSDVCLAKNLTPQHTDGSENPTILCMVSENPMWNYPKSDDPPPQLGPRLQTEAHRFLHILYQMERIIYIFYVVFDSPNIIIISYLVRAYFIFHWKQTV